MIAELFAFPSTSPEATIGFAQNLARILKRGDCLLLDGPVGAGKSVVSRAIIQSLLATPEDVPSPTFTLVQTYEAPECDIWHCDFYRLSSPNEIFELGLIDAFADCITLIEWPDGLGALAPENALHISISDRGDDSRLITLKGRPAEWATRLEGLGP